MSVFRNLRKFSSSDIAASILLFVAAIAAAVIANSSFAPAYQEFLNHELNLQIGRLNLLSHGGENLRVIEFINDGLMTIFFLMVGLEIKRELLVGELSSFGKAVLPFIAACGGMLLPVLIYTFICPPGTEGGGGMAIPMATDIAFSLGVLSLLGNRVPLSLKIFLTAFAVVDDIGGILVIAIFYSSHILVDYLLIAALLFLVLYLIGQRGTNNKIFFLIIGVLIWYLFLQSGIHSTISGVLLAFVIPAKPRLDVGRYIERIRHTISEFPEMESESIVLTNEQIAKLKEVESASDRVISPLQSLEDNLHGAVNYFILPLFAFVNAGVVFGGGDSLIGHVSMAVTLSLLLGKFIGIYLFTGLAIKLRVTTMPEGMNWTNLAGVSLLGGIGFTVSLFIANLSFGVDYPVLLNQAKFGVLSGSILSGVLGYLLLRSVLHRGD
ncbi:Na+/H+ antiporter NhaA [Bacteroides pyogenes]|uniref:Na(+)/H(+) antiporter NhaA n=1 Tax=Bacteroides pyogenes DSM 20611 = JCM 6294 TaxID=1121100 RepID=W4PFB4_9BACE|nr:Na+/H+ antiporter NhaA [Bacteroides pyogenes]GAE21105.1 Na+/H+ antiporter NhaA type [Bacteroides pyogenes JCM 10003]MBB3894746.1 NhaA family Na+:H+ antiporter [Bacteroides pyogenes]MCF2708919.1 Na+/H+ antiporter NhaA [Bacteroides pyogenes]MCI7071426.1 Na+/H+ antiporter NhaA [Bacteroides pyogenes]MDY4249493.1 Na+/H+ antiporter NhaA [Bacteroides pyogenes]